jgi:PAS domain S-box-containing protein
LNILKKAKRVLRLPDVAAAEPLRRSSIYILTWIIAEIGLIAFLVFYSFFADSYKVAPMIGLALALVLSFIFYKRGSLDIAVNVLVWSFLAGLFGLAVVNDGLRDTALDTMPALLVVSALLLRKRPFMIMSLLYLLSLFALGLLQVNRILVYPPAYSIDPTDLFDILGIDGATIVLVTMLSTLLRKSLARVKDGAELLSESELRYRDLFDNAGMAIFQSGLKGEVLAVNPEFARMFGFDSPEEVRAEFGDASNFFVDPNRRSEIIRIKKEHPDLSVFENLYRRKDGSSFLGRLNVRMIRNQVGGPQFIQGFIEDITESRRVESALLESQALTYAIVNSTPDWIWSVDIENFALMMFNEGMRDYFLERRGISVRTGMHPEELFPSEDYILLWRGYYERALREGPYTAEYPVFAGTNILQLTFNLLKRDGRTYGISVFGRGGRQAFAGGEGDAAARAVSPHEEQHEHDHRHAEPAGALGRRPAPDGGLHRRAESNTLHVAGAREAL